MTEDEMSPLARYAVERMLRQADLPMTPEFIEAAYNLSGLKPRKLSAAYQKRQDECDEEVRQYERRTILREVARLQGNP